MSNKVYKDTNIGPAKCDTSLHAGIDPRSDYCFTRTIHQDSDSSSRPGSLLVIVYPAGNRWEDK